jgi:hypothetical protein
MLPESCWGHPQGHHLAGCEDWPGVENGNSDTGTDLQHKFQSIKFDKISIHLH